MKKVVVLIIISLILLFGCPEILAVNSIEPTQHPTDEPAVAKMGLISRSAEISDIGMAAAREMLILAFNENITEADVARAAEDAMLDSGSSENIEAFPVLVMSGEDSALPHGDSSDDETNQILPGEVVVIDLGARFMGYCSDLTRTFFMGEPTEEMVKIYGIIQEAQTAGISAVRSGVTGHEVDKAARDIIDRAGYGENFTHGLGHGVGVYIHQPPLLAPGSYEPLVHGHDMVVTIEPGIYLTGRFGIRIEDDVAVDRLGRTVLTHAPKTLEDAILFPEGYVNNTENETGGHFNIRVDTLAEALPYLLIPIIIIILIVVYFKILKKRRE
ncbi:MAG: M24 family metallopeptidase [Thermoplasmata archaeon]|nr:M24 family metallopeptidase [Thermoplasmata archaeon]